MRSAVVAIAFTLTGFFIGAVFFVAASLVLAWTGPTSAPPNGNVSAPINVGTTDQIKNAGLGINALAVFGNAILSGTSRYLNFGTIPDEQPPSSGYGIRDNAGTLEFKNTGGSWGSLTSLVSSAIQNFFASGSSNAVSQIKFSDGTVQTSAPSGGGISAVTTATCTFSHGLPCTASCPSGYFRTGCGTGDSDSGTQPSGNGCKCTNTYSQCGMSGCPALTCYSYCAK